MKSKTQPIKIVRNTSITSAKLGLPKRHKLIPMPTYEVLKPIKPIEPIKPRAKTTRK